MRRTLTAIMVTSIAGGALLLASTLALDALDYRLSVAAQASQPVSLGKDIVVVDNPNQGLEVTYFQAFVWCSVASTIWTVFVVAPSLIVSRRAFADASMVPIAAAAVVCVISGIAFFFLEGYRTFIPNMLVFAVGGAIGLMSVLLLARLLPPNLRIERAHESKRQQ